MKIEWSKISLFFLFIVASIGTLLRATFFIPLPFQYSHLVHSHSHVAFQGWIYSLIFLLLIRLFLTEKQIQKGYYPLQFKLSIAVIIAILISFSLQGYALYSILFSSLFQFLNYWFIFSFFRDVKHSEQNIKNSISLRFVKTGLLLGLLSTLVPWGIGILSAKGLNTTELYRSFIYSFLHFQYNGYFLFVVIGLFFKCLEKDKILYDKKLALKFYYFFSIAVIPALSLSFLGMSFREFIIIPAYLAASLQIIAAVFFFRMLKGIVMKWFLEKNIWFQLFFTVFVVSFLLKIALQFLSVLPLFQQDAFGNKSIVLAYLHLSLIGAISFLFVALMIDLKWIKINAFSKIGSTLLLLGFIMTELILMLNGLALMNDHILLFAGSAAMAVGILFLLFSPQKAVSFVEKISD